MPDLVQVEQRMREDWNARAGEDATTTSPSGGATTTMASSTRAGAEVEWELKRVPTPLLVTKK